MWSIILVVGDVMGIFLRWKCGVNIIKVKLWCYLSGVNIKVIIGVKDRDII